MSQLRPSDYHFCTLNELQSPKPLPSLDFVAKLIDICHVPNTLFESSQRNIYDRKNHILYINNFQSYSHTLQEKYGRSTVSFEKQLKMMGFKKRKIKQSLQESQQNFKEINSPQRYGVNSLEDKGQIKRDDFQQRGLFYQQENNRNFVIQTHQQAKQKNQQIKYMFIWRTNRSALIENQLINFEQKLSEQISKAIKLKQEMEKRKIELDVHLETIIFQSLMNSCQYDSNDGDTGIVPQNINSRQKSRSSNETILNDNLSKALKELRLLSNQTQIQSKQYVRNISRNLSTQLQLYRMLIFKEQKVHHTIQEE